MLAFRDRVGEAALGEVRAPLPGSESVSSRPEESLDLQVQIRKTSKSTVKLYDLDAVLQRARRFLTTCHMWEASFVLTSRRSRPYHSSRQRPVASVPSETRSIRDWLKDGAAGYSFLTDTLSKHHHVSSATG